MAIDRIQEYRPIPPVNRSRRERDGRRRTRRERPDDGKPRNDEKGNDKEHMIDERV